MVIETLLVQVRFSYPRRVVRRSNLVQHIFFALSADCICDN